MGANNANECGAACGCGSDMLPHDPQCALNFHYGMLLGAEDFRVEQGFHVGKSRRHNSSLHGNGVVWGLGVSHDPKNGEIEVEPGLAIDGQGRELTLDKKHCLSLVAWWQKHLKDPELANQAQNNIVEFDAEVVACYSTCLSRPVPAIAQCCTGESSGTAYSRLCETICLCFRVVKKGENRNSPPPGYHNLRLLLGLDPIAKDEEGKDIKTDLDRLAQRDAVAALGGQARVDAAQQLWHEAAVADALERYDSRPEGATNADDGCLVLARLSKVKLTRTDTGWQTDVGSVDNAVRPVLLPTAALQDFFAAALLAPQPAVPQAVALRSVSQTPGPQVLAKSVVLAGDKLSFATEQPLHPASVKKEAFELSAFSERDGWHSVIVKSAKLTRDGRGVTLTLEGRTEAALLRFVARGTGARPLLGKDLKPLAGAGDSGTDFVDMISGD